MALSLSRILDRSGGRWANRDAVSQHLRELGEAGVLVQRPAPLLDSKQGDLAYFFSKEYKEELPRAHPTVLITADPFLGPLEKSGLPLWSESVIVSCPDPHLAMGVLSEDFARALSTIAHLDRPEVTRIHPTAVVHPGALLGKQVTIGPHCVIESGARIGDGSVLYPSTYIGPEVTLGADCVLFPGVVIYENCLLGDRVRIHANSVVGADGFGYAPRKTAQGMAGHQKIHHLGRVVIGDDVEIGASTTVDRSTLGDTRIDRFAKLDNQVQIGHNAHVGEGAIVCGGSALAGRARLGRYAVVGGLTGIANAVLVGDGASVGALSLVTRDIAPGGTGVGNPQRDYAEHFRAHAALNRLLTDRSRSSQEKQ